MIIMVNGELDLNEQFVINTLKYYSNRMCLLMPKKLLLYKSEAVKTSTDEIWKRSVVNGEILGTNFGCYNGSPVFINIEENRTKNQLINTIIHELLHSTGRKDHNLEFYYTISEIKDGYYPPRKFTNFKKKIWKMKRWFYE